MTINKLNNNVSILDIVNNQNTLVQQVNTSDSLFIPRGTVFNINPNGSGNFLNLNEAANYLCDKYSNGAITLQLSAGEHNLTSVLFDGYYHNIKQLIINGAGKDQTIIRCANQNKGAVAIDFKNGLYSLLNLSLINENPSNYNNNSRGINCAWYSQVVAENVLIKGFEYGYWSFTQGRLLINNSAAEQCARGIVAETGRIDIAWDTTLLLKNCSMGFYAGGGGTISGYTSKCTFSSVSTNKSTNGNGAINVAGI